MISDRLFSLTTVANLSGVQIRRTVINSVFGLAAASAAFLVVSIQPALALTLIPHTGGHPHFWAASQALFQALLVLGYLLAGKLRPVSGSRIRQYATILLIGGLWAIASPLLLPTHANSIVVITLLAIVPVSLPFICLATYSIVAQMLVSDPVHRRRPVWIFAVSNMGSLFAALTYPFLIEPHIDLSTQIHLWLVGSAGLLWLAGLLLLRSPSGLEVGGLNRSPTRPNEANVGTQVRWYLGGVGPVGLSLSCTSYVATDLGSQPMVWLGPFSAYLLTLILAFSERGSTFVAWVARAGPLAIVALVALLMGTRATTFGVYWAHIGVLTVVLSCWHWWLRNQIPADGSLPRFYACVALGGASAALILSFVVPVALDPALFHAERTAIGHLLWDTLGPEYLVLALFACLVVPRGVVAKGWSRYSGWLEAAILGGTLLVIIPRLLRGGFDTITVSLVTSLYIAAIGTALFRLKSRDQLVAASLGLLGTAWVVSPSATERIVLWTRSPFGLLQVTDGQSERRLMNGSTIHGSQGLNCVVGQNAATCLEPTSYYERAGPLGRILEGVRRSNRRLDIGAIGLGVGTVAAYCGPHDRLTFIEVDSRVVEIAERQFRFLAAARGVCSNLALELGDARLVLRRFAPQAFDVIIADAFSSDWIPVHLMTKEALAEFSRTLRDSGVIAYHVSGRQFDVAPLLVAAAREAALGSITVDDPAIGGGRNPSAWVFITKDAAMVDRLRAELLAPSGSLRERTVKTVVAWSDERHSLMVALRR